MEEKVLLDTESIVKTIIERFKQYKVSNLNLTSIGNSISSGYSMINRTIPLLARMPFLASDMEAANINTRISHFAKARDNSDSLIVNFLLDNIKLKEVFTLNRRDMEKCSDLPKAHFTAADMDKYYPRIVNNDIGLRDLLSESSNSLANIAIYNGATGSLIDNMTRNGHNLNPFSSVKKDIKSIEQFLYIVQNNNRVSGSTTQVYLCGVPSILFGLSNLCVNEHLRALANNYANVTYVEPVATKLIKDGIDGKGYDVHYNELEYAIFNQHIMSSIRDNYIINLLMIEIDTKLYQLDSLLKHSTQRDYSDLISKLLETEIERYYELLKQYNININVFVDNLVKYLESKYCHEFYYTREQIVIPGIQRIKTK